MRWIACCGNYLGPAVLAALLFWVHPGAGNAQGADMPLRKSARPETTSGVPHIQLGVRPDAKLSEALLNKVASWPGVALGPTRVSMPGAIGFQLLDGIALARPEVIVGGREFAHLHPDGSLHASLDPEIASKAVTAGWAIAHPWSKQREGWDGFVMIYTPTNAAELEVVIQLVAGSYSYVTGQSIDN